jgi:hypothetical protein
MINTSGILASYPTKLKYHPQSPYLKADSVKKILTSVTARDPRHRAHGFL